MNSVRYVLLIVTAALGVALIVRGAWGGVWPLSIQLVAGALLLTYALLRLRYR